MDIPEIDADEALARLGAGGTLFMDLRDPASFAAGHVPGAVSVGDATIQRFLGETDRNQPVVVYCYHGQMSLGGTGFLRENDFTDTASLRGGFAAWTGPTERGG